MSLAENLLNSLPETTYENSRTAGSGYEEEHIVIDEQRNITVPNNLKVIAVKGDKDIETVIIDCIRYWDGHDLSTFAIYINYILPNGDEGTYIPENIETLDDVFSFSWVIGKEITYNSGQLVFWIVAKLTDDNGELLHQWSSFQNFECSIAPGGDKIYVPEKQTDQDVISQAISVSRQSAEIAQSAATSANDKAAIANEAADRAEDAAERAEAAGGGSSVIVDNTLTISGAAADAKVTGDRINALNDEKVNKTDIIDNLTSELTDKPLSAKQGVVIKGLIDGLNTALTTLGTRTTTLEGKVTTLENTKPDMSGYVTTEQFETALGAYITDIDNIVGGGIEIPKLATPVIYIDTDIKGNAIENAVGYQLFKKVDENYTSIASYNCGNDYECFTAGAKLTSDGALTSNTDWVNELVTDFILVDHLANNKDNMCALVHPDSSDSSRVVIAFYKTNDGSTFVTGATYNEWMNSVGVTAEDVKLSAESAGAKYVRFSSPKNETVPCYVCFTNEILFPLDDLKLDVGTHQLVVKAIGEGDVDLNGDGTIYQDSDYSNEVEYVVEEDVKTYTLHASGTGATSGLSYYTPDEIPSDKSSGWSDFEFSGIDIPNIKNFVYIQHYFDFNASASTTTNCTLEQITNPKCVKVTITGDNPSCTIWVDD